MIFRPEVPEPRRASDEDGYQRRSAAGPRVEHDDFKVPSEATIQTRSDETAVSKPPPKFRLRAILAKAISGIAELGNF